MATLRGDGFPESLIQKFAPYPGKKRVEAGAFLKTHPLWLTNEEIDIVNRRVMTGQSKDCIGKWDKQIKILRITRPNAPCFHQLTSAQQTIVFSRHYHQGPGWHQLSSNRQVYNALVNNGWNAVKRHWSQLMERNRNSWPGWKRERFKRE